MLILNPAFELWEGGSRDPFVYLYQDRLGNQSKAGVSTFNKLKYSYTDCLFIHKKVTFRSANQSMSLRSLHATNSFFDQGRQVELYMRLCICGAPNSNGYKNMWLYSRVTSVKYGRMFTQNIPLFEIIIDI